MDSLNAIEIRMVKTVGKSEGRCAPDPYAVIDPGATEDLVGGLGWRISYISNQVEILSGALTGIRTKALPKVDAITAIETIGGEAILIGMGGVTCDSRKVQYESLFNSHHLRAHGTIVDNVAKEHGGKQCLKIKVDEKNKKCTSQF